MTSGNFRLGRFQIDGRVVMGRLEGNEIGVVHEGDSLADVLCSELGASDSVRKIPVGDAIMLPPIDARSRIFAVAINYRAHGVESSAKPPERPLIFYKAPSNFVAHGGSLNPNKAVTSKLDYEGEIAVVIGRTCKSVAAKDALDYVAGACAFNDGSARDLVKLPAGSDYWPDWTAAKGLDGASALGPAITCGGNIVDRLRRRELTVTTRVNGEVVQSGDMTEMIFSTEQIIETLSSYMTLMPGDVIATARPRGSVLRETASWRLATNSRSKSAALTLSS
jgi:2-keto-4-pentenoate hydratase/2-oxohepta-3-ene-1,7-dioic acid hydratase in catechol pathway